MRMLAPVLAFAVAALAPASAAPPGLSAKAEKLLAGRTASEPVDCIDLSRNTSSTIVDRTALIYKESRHRWWVTTLADGQCTGLAPSRTLITVVPGAQRLCRPELVRIVDAPTGFDYGSCPLGAFTPYTR